MKIEKSSEKVVYMGGTLEDLGWGFVQFPHLYEMVDGRIGLFVHDEDDAPHTLGNGLYFVSGDEGETWQRATEHEIEMMGKALPNGDVLQIKLLPTLDITDIKMPPSRFGNKKLPTDDPDIKKSIKEDELPLAITIEGDIYGSRRYVYYLDTLPDKISEKRFLFSRFKKGGERAEEEFAQVNWKYRTIAAFDPSVVYGGDSKLLLENPGLYSCRNIKVAPDGSLYIAHYRLRSANPYTGVYTGKGAAFILRSDDMGKSWYLKGYIGYVPDKNNRYAYLNGGYSEPTVEFLGDGRMMCILRTCDVFWGAPEWGPTYVSYSSDMGATWSEPTMFADRGALPILTKMKNGLVTAMITRPGISVYVSEDGLSNWEKVEIMADGDRSGEGNVVPERANFWQYAGSCCNTSVMEISGDRLLIAFSDFYTPDENGVKRKAIKTITIKIQK